MPPQKERNNFWLTFVTGGISGICGKTVIAPIERVKYIFVVDSTDLRQPIHFRGRLAGGQVDRTRDWLVQNVAG